MIQRQGWSGVFRLRQGGREWHVCNEIRDYGRRLTFELWSGLTDERFAGFRLLTFDCRGFAGKSASFRIDGTDLVSTALFTSGEVSDVPAFVQLISTADRVIAETEVPSGINADEAVQIERRDTLALNV